MAHTFELNSEALKRQFAVYVVIATDGETFDLYVGKTGDNREGCNPLISRCGNHFSYNKIHSQVRNKIPDHELKEYTYVFDHFGEYSENEEVRKPLVDLINEMERHLNEEICNLAKRLSGCHIHNPFSGKHVSKKEKLRRYALRTQDTSAKIMEIVAEVERVIVNKTMHATRV